MAPTVHYAEPDGREAREGNDETGLATRGEGTMPNAGEVGDRRRRSGSDLSKEISEQGTASEILTPNDGRRRSSRLRGKFVLGNVGQGDESPPVTAPPVAKPPSGSKKRGRRKKVPVLESVQSIGDSVVELGEDMVVKSPPQELATKLEDLGTTPAVNGALLCCASISGEPIVLHDNGHENVAKLESLDPTSTFDAPRGEDGKGAGADFCDSNIFDNLQSIVNLHPDENAIHIDVPSASRIEIEEKVETLAEELPEANLRKEGIREASVGLQKSSSGGIGVEESAVGAVTTVSIVVQAGCEIASQSRKTLTMCETEPVESDLKGEGVSRGSDSSSKIGDDGPKLNGNDEEDGLKLNGNDGEDSSSVTSRDDVAHTTTTSENRGSKASSGDHAGGGVSTLASKAPLNDVLMATNSELPVEEAIDVQLSKGIPNHSKGSHEDDDHLGSRSSSEAKFSRVTPSNSKILARGSQLLLSGNDGQQNASSIVLEGRETLQTTSEIVCPRSGEREDPLQFGKKSDSLKSVNQEKGICGGGVPSATKVENKAEVAKGLPRLTVGGEDDSSGVTESDVNTTSEKVDESVGINSRAGWVKCDDCKKWRSIPVDLAEKIGETNVYWSCKENPDKHFSDCSIPQVKSNEEINRELEISESSYCDEEDDADATCDSRPLYNGIQAVTENGQAVWTLIKRNIFKHRSQKHQNADETMVCQCGPPKPGEVACGDDCLNRMLNIECLPQQCPCGSSCTNQQFQKRSYAKLELFRCGKKGHGLRALENIQRGSFIIEYVGEVLDMASFEERQKDYSLNSQKHFYFMTLSANEIIDACSKGNLGRFINHSCEPNCATEKWMVDGEVCIGLFAIRDLKEGEEITFDYNFVRVGGADAKKCECGANKCRGFIGVDPDTPQNVVDIDSDEGEDPEPIMLQAESDDELHGVFDKTKEGTVKKPRMITVSDSRSEKIGGVKRKFYSGATKDTERPKTKRRVKTAASSKIGTFGPASSKLFAGPRLGVRNTYLSDVEEKLTDLTGENGGLRKQKDAAKKYLKLLVLTAASGGTVNGAAACSARDLSMLLEALLKTHRSNLLKDVMNKNGLQMFHNLLKQFRKSFEKRPILRKLLKVLDHLAKHKVLTVEHVYSPPRSGTECFSDTLFNLSRHDDSEVQKMARDFRKQYVPPRPHKPFLNNVKLPLQQPPVAVSSPLVIESPQVGSTASNSAEQIPPAQGGPVEKSTNPPTVTKRKRPSRWDTVPDNVATAVAIAPFGMPNSAAAVVRPLPPVSGSPQASMPMPSGIPGRPSGPFPPVQQAMQPGGFQHQVYPPSQVSVGFPGQRQAMPPGPVHLGMQRPPMGNELPPAAQRPYSGPRPAQGPLQIPPGGVHPPPYGYNRGHSNQHAGAPVQWQLIHPRGGPMFAGSAPPPLPPSARPGWGGHNGPRQADAFAGHVRIVSTEPGESEGGAEPPVPGMSPASLRGTSRTSEKTTNGARELAPGSDRLNRSSGPKSEAPPQTHREDHRARMPGHDLIGVNRFHKVADGREPTQQVYPHPEYHQGSQGRVQREMSWETPECSNFHHHVSGMIRARVETKHLVHYKDLEKFCSKLTEVVTRKEIKKYRDNKVQGVTKTILRSKLLEKVDAYVDMQIELYSKSKSGEGQS